MSVRWRYSLERGFVCPVGVSYYDEPLTATAAADHSVPEFRGQAAEMQAGRALCHLLLLQVTQLVAAVDIAPDLTPHRETYNDGNTKTPNVENSCALNSEGSDKGVEGLFEFNRCMQGKCKSHSTCSQQKLYSQEKNATLKSPNSQERTISTKDEIKVIRDSDEPLGIPWTTYIPWPSRDTLRDTDTDLMTSLPDALWERMETIRGARTPCKGKLMCTFAHKPLTRCKWWLLVAVTRAKYRDNLSYWLTI